MQLLLTLLIPTLVAVVSWFVGSWLAARRDRENKRRELRLQYLIDAYRRLSNAAERNLAPPYAQELESAVADIQLFGSAAQLVLLRQIANDQEQTGDWSKSGRGLLTSLRDELRAELRLEPVTGGFLFYRAAPSGNEKKGK